MVLMCGSAEFQFFTGPIIVNMWFRIARRNKRGLWGITNILLKPRR